MCKKYREKKEKEKQTQCNKKNVKKQKNNNRLPIGWRKDNAMDSLEKLCQTRDTTVDEVEKSTQWKGEKNPSNHDQNMNCKRQNWKMYCIHPTVKSIQFPLCYFRYEKMPLRTLEKEVLEQRYALQSWCSLYINCNYMDFKISVSSSCTSVLLQLSEYVCFILSRCSAFHSK